MSHSIPRTIRLRPSASIIPGCQHRLFSSTALRAKAGGVQTQRVSQRGLHPSQRSSMKDQMRSKEGQMLAKRQYEDLGLLEGTFVKQTGIRMPSLFSQPKAWLAIWRKQIWTSLRSMQMILYYKWSNRKLTSPYAKVYHYQGKELRRVAKKLYEEFQSAMAQGNTTKLESLTCSGLYDHVRKPLEYRSKHAKVKWTLERWVKEPQIVSNRAANAPLPGTGTIGFRQVIVRLRTKQSLRREGQGMAKFGESDARKSEVEDLTIDSKTVTEYMVMQERIYVGEKEPWKVHSFVDEMSLDSFRAREARNTQRQRAALLQQQEQAAMA